VAAASSFTELLCESAAEDLFFFFFFFCWTTPSAALLLRSTSRVTGGTGATPGWNVYQNTTQLKQHQHTAVNSS